MPPAVGVASGWQSSAVAGFRLGAAHCALPRQVFEVGPGHCEGTGVGAADRCHLSISDDGPSIPVDERQRIFQRFHRLLGTQEDGSGLGLAIVREIASLHGASITLEEDTDGVGNTFTVHFVRRGA